MPTVRSAGVKITIAGVDISTAAASFLKSFNYSDVMGGSADTAEIELHDKERLWTAAWFPKRGDTAEITLTRENWSGSGTDELPLGSFEVDEISNKYSGSGGNDCSIKLISIPQNTNLRNVNKNKSWEKFKLSAIIGEIAGDAGLTLFYDTEEDPEIERAEQRDESNLKFLERICADYGLSVKISDGKIIIFDEEKYESQPPVKTLKYGDNNIKSFSGTAKIHEIYKACHVKYQHGEKSEGIEYTYTDESKEDGLTLEINKKVENEAEAEKLAKKELRKKNREEIRVSLSLIGDFDYLAGNVLELDGEHGFYSGNYLITRSDFRIGNGFECSLELRKCLNGY